MDSISIRRRAGIHPCFRSVLAALFVLVVAAPASAVPFRLQAVADGEIFDLGVDGFESIDPSLSRAGFNACALGCTVPWRSRAVFEFDLDLLPAQASTGSIMLGLNLVNADNGGNGFEVYGFTGNGVLDLSDALQTGELVAFVQPFVTPGQFFFDVTSFVNDHLTMGESFVAFMVKGEHETTFGAPFFVHGSAKEFIDTSDNPTTPNAYPSLFFDVVPEPSTVALLGLGLLGLATIGRRSAHGSVGSGSG